MARAPELEAAVLLEEAPVQLPAGGQRFARVRCATPASLLLAALCSVAAVYALGVHAPTNRHVRTAWSALWGLPFTGGGAAAPSLFCFSVIKVQGFELQIMQAQLLQGAGIFACEHQLVFSDNPVQLGTDFYSIGIGAVSSKLGGQGNVATSSWLNTDVFLKVWEEVGHRDAFRSYDYTVKVDADTVFIPTVLRQHLQDAGLPPVSEKYYLVNCEHVDDGLYGALEVVSQAAAVAFVEGLDTCLLHLNFQTWGEDLFLQRCMDSLGARGEPDYTLVVDGYCNRRGVSPPCLPGASGYHPFKDTNSWMTCFREAQGGPMLVSGPGGAVPVTAPPSVWAGGGAAGAAVPQMRMGSLEQEMPTSQAMHAFPTAAPAAAGSLHDWPGLAPPAGREVAWWQRDLKK